MTDLTGKIAVVTGGNSGIGYATAERLKADGAQVIITGRSQERVDEAAAALDVMGLVADVNSVTALGQLAEEVKELVGSIDILFINAGVFEPAPLGSISEEMFDRQIGINFKGAVFTLEKFLPILNDGASVVNLSSVNAYTGMATTAIYAASKAAMNSFTRTAATELAPRKIRVNAVNPGPIQTPIFSKTGLPEAELSGFASAMVNRIPLKRLGEPSEVAHLVSFLASENASFITGGEYNIDGGININPLLN
ncbi:MAG: SDR family oxidoreductase [Lewinella sp.]